jgi:hypothetical protein
MIILSEDRSLDSGRPTDGLNFRFSIVEYRLENIC